MTLPELMAWAGCLLPFAYWLFLSRTRGTGITLTFWTFGFGAFMLAEQNMAVATSSLVICGYLAGAVQVAFSNREWLQGFSRFMLAFLTLVTGLAVYLFFGIAAGQLVPIIALVLFAMSFGQSLALNAKSYGVLDVKGGYED
ncbi:MAG: hypothetical protein K2X77_19495 [Candidatus Obscuribacterales bacterium]|nr:hypothetical protein [Candidatus Obscuribacterales bacterium]